MSLEIVNQVHSQVHPDGSPQSNLGFLLMLIQALYQDGSSAGLLRKDGGENIVYYPPKDVNVSTSRVCFPDGAIVKVLTDVGTGGTNGPAWNPEEPIEPNRYVRIFPMDPVEPPVEPQDPPGAPIDPLPDLTPVLAEIVALRASVASLEASVVSLQSDLKLTQDLSAAVLSRLINPVSTSRSWGHTHWVKL